MDFIKLTKRLQTVAQMVSHGNVVADVGTDHGYLPIYLIQNKITDKVIAMDVNKGPLQKASAHISQFHLQDNILLRLSDGLEQLALYEAQTVTICGMGGKLISEILARGKDIVTKDMELILSPQSELRQFREYLAASGYRIIKETMLIDDKKYYTIIKCKISDSTVSQSTTTLKDDVFFRYGEYLLTHKNNTLLEYLKREQNMDLLLYQKLVDTDSVGAAERIKEIKYELKCIEEGLKYYEVQ